MSSRAETIWLVVGFGGQGFFFLRFLVQWISSERAGRSVIPVAFWYLSLGGAFTLMAYAIYRRDPVFIIGQAFGFLVYTRNLQLIHRRARDTKPPGDSATPTASPHVAPTESPGEGDSV